MSSSRSCSSDGEPDRLGLSARSTSQTEMTPEDVPRIREEAAKPNGAPALSSSPLAFGHV